ncbi:MAG: neutral/alkaline non-lysosomal ceramidase N-terminal domain-containing protein [Cyclobacteriaceae bacterium]
MKKAFKVIGWVFLSLIVALLILITGLYLVNMLDKHPGYSADLQIEAGAPAPMQVGFAAEKVTPEVPDQWEDKNGDAKYKPEDGDTYTDLNGNGQFDPVWIAGFSNSKPANGIHDDVWARAMVIDDGITRLAIVSLDAIGYMHNDVVDIRKMIPEEAGITYMILSSTHTHEGADLMGIWGESPFKSGVDQTYMQFVKEQVVESVVTAVNNLSPARLEISQDLTGADGLVKDTRDPQVFDNGLRMIRAVDKDTEKTLGTLVSWGNHPETLWSRNLLISSDFPHYVREGVENGMYSGDSLIHEGVGGVTVYVSAAIGGLMCTHPSLTIVDPFTGEEFAEPSFAKAEAQGRHLSNLILNAMDNPIETIDSTGISLLVKTIELPLDNNVFKLASLLGVIDRGPVGWMKTRSELAIGNIGPLSFVAIPGEIYPELVNGGVEAPPGGDYPGPIIETPPIREMMPGKYKFVFGLANDEIGYIIPKTQWDVEAPYSYGRDNSPYGEENSLGPETASILHTHLKDMFGVGESMK